MTGTGKAEAVSKAKVVRCPLPLSGSLVVFLFLCYIMLLVLHSLTPFYGTMNSAKAETSVAFSLRSL